MRVRINIDDCLPNGEGPNRFHIGDMATVIEKLPDDDKYDFYLFVESSEQALYFRREELVLQPGRKTKPRKKPKEL